MCVGVGNYRYEDKLDNTVRDAEEVNKKLKSVTNCYSTFLLFLFYYVGHAIQLNSKVYLVPRMTKVDNRSMYDVE